MAEQICVSMPGGKSKRDKLMLIEKSVLICAI